MIEVLNKCLPARPGFIRAGGTKCLEFQEISPEGGLFESSYTLAFGSRDDARVYLFPIRREQTRDMPVSTRS